RDLDRAGAGRGSVRGSPCISLAGIGNRVKKDTIRKNNAGSSASAHRSHANNNPLQDQATVIMAGPPFVCETDRTGLTPLLTGGGPVFRRSDGLHEGLTRRCGRDVANLFADPVASTDGRTISWYGEAAGEPLPLASLDPEKRKGPEALLRS